MAVVFYKKLAIRVFSPVMTMTRWRQGLERKLVAVHIMYLVDLYCEYARKFAHHCMLLGRCKFVSMGGLDATLLVFNEPPSHVHDSFAIF